MSRLSAILLSLGRRGARVNVPPASSSSDDWAAEGFEAELRSRPRLLVLYYSDACEESRAFIPAFAEAEVASSVPTARANLRDPRDARWALARVTRTPTVAYYEHGEELERVEPPEGRGIGDGELEAFLDQVEDLQDQWRLRHGRLRLDRFG